MMKNSVDSNLTAAVGGAVILAFVMVALFAKLELGANQTVLVIFGGLLIAAPLIARFTIGKDGLVFETATPKISEALDQHDKAIKNINENVLKLTNSLEELRKQVEATLQANEPGDKAADYAAIGSKILNITEALTNNKAVIQLGTEASRKVREIVGNNSRDSVAGQKN